MNLENLPILALRGLENNSLTYLNNAQLAVLPYLYEIATLYWCIWWGILGYCTTRFMGVPLWKKLTKHLAKTKS